MVLLHKMKTSSVRTILDQIGWTMAEKTTERSRHLLQITIPLPRRIHHTVPGYVESRA